MTETTEPLTEAQIGEIEARHGNRPLIGYLEAGIGSLRGGDDAIHLLTTDIPALIRDWRAMKARLTACEGSRCVHELDNHHNALACGYCAGPIKEESTRLTAENADLREQLATAEKEQEPCRQVQKRGVHSSVTCACVIAMEKSQ